MIYDSHFRASDLRNRQCHILQAHLKVFFLFCSCNTFVIHLICLFSIICKIQSNTIYIRDCLIWLWYHFGNTQIPKKIEQKPNKNVFWILMNSVILKIEISSFFFVKFHDAIGYLQNIQSVKFIPRHRHRCHRWRCNYRKRVELHLAKPSN